MGIKHCQLDPGQALFIKKDLSGFPVLGENQPVYAGFVNPGQDVISSLLVCS